MITFQVAAERVLERGNFSQALKLFELSRVSYNGIATSRSDIFLQCAPQQIIHSFAKQGKVPELVQYLHQVT